MATTSKKVYLASDILYAFIDRTHGRHKQVSAFFRYFAQENYVLYTDSISIYETYIKLIQEMSATIAKDFLRTMYISNITIFSPEESEMKAALKIYLNDKSGDLNFRTSLMAILADRKSIPQIATFEYIHTMFGLTIFYIPI